MTNIMAAGTVGDAVDDIYVMIYICLIYETNVNTMLWIIDSDHCTEPQ